MSALFESIAASSKAKDMATNGMMCGNWWGWSCTSFGTFIACPCNLAQEWDLCSLETIRFRSELEQTSKTGAL